MGFRYERAFDIWTVALALRSFSLNVVGVKISTKTGKHGEKEGIVKNSFLRGQKQTSGSTCWGAVREGRKRGRKN